ncbi:MAG TPA: LamG domain-containing protein [Phycisphaeraceae bacterium]
MLFARMLSKGNSWDFTPDHVGGGAGNVQIATMIGGTERNLYGPVVTPSDGWVHLAVVFDQDAGTLTMYRNAVQVAQLTGLISLTTDDSGAHFRLASGPADNFKPIDGRLDEVRISDVALTPDQLGYHGTLVPEPGVAALACGLGWMIGLARRRKA